MQGAVARLGRIDGAALRAARERQGLSQFTVALRSGLTIGTISRAENGTASRKTVERLAAILRVPAHQLAPDLVPPPAPSPPPQISPPPEFQVGVLPSPQEIPR